jgi:hypothetical protein
MNGHAPRLHTHARVQNAVTAGWSTPYQISQTGLSLVTRCQRHGSHGPSSGEQAGASKDALQRHPTDYISIAAAARLSAGNMHRLNKVVMTC